jgi:hypothetical protein
LDGNIPKLRGGDRFTYGIYYACASQFGWSKEEVDRQPIEYLKKLFAMHKEQMEDAKKQNSIPINRSTNNMAKNLI